jgi:mannose-6-phosphate isomerase-like protein (cupin superfamily)
MKEAKLERAKEFKNSDSCIALEYPLGDEDINAAVIKLNGRYPETGRAVNTNCKEMGYIVEGTGKLGVEDKTVELKKGDVVLIEAGEKYYWEGNLIMFMPCTPAWTPEQHKLVP